MNMRINGFSGMDIDSMVKSLMTVKRVPLDKLDQKKQILEWTRDSYREFNSKIVQLTNKLQQISLNDATNTQKSTVTGNTTAVRADAQANASGVSMEVNVLSLAKKAGVQSSTGLQISGGTQAATKSTTLAQLAGSSTPSTYELNINDTTVSFASTDTLDVVIARISSSVPTVNATFDEVSGKFMITHKEYGKNITDTGTNKSSAPSSLTTLLQLNVPTDFGTGKMVEFTKGKVEIKSDLSSTAKTYDTDSDKLLVNGINLTFLEASGSTSSKIVTQSDPTKAVDTIKSFVESYNELLGLMNSKLSEQSYRDFPPLTDEQRKAMNEDDIKNWEEKAKSGLLKNDSILSAAVNAMRMVITNNLKGLSEAGITTGQYYEKGQLKIDEEKLKEALTSNPDKVLSIFRGSDSDINSKPIFNELRKGLNTTLDLFVKKVGTSKFDTDASMSLKTESIMGDQLKGYNARIKDLESKMTMWETRYYKQFAAMEKAMSQFQSQSSSLASYFQ